MLNVGLVIVAAAVVMAPASQEATGDFIALFDGPSFEGWEGDETVFRVADGAIVGGTLERPNSAKGVSLHDPGVR